jgi:hypothetical protein
VSGKTLRAREPDTAFRRLGFRLLVLSFATASWNAVMVRHIQLGDIFLAAAAVCLGCDVLATMRVPRWTLTRGMWIGAVLIGMAGLWTAVSPASHDYLAARYDGIVAYVPPGIGRPGGNLTQLGKFEVALIVLPLLALMAAPTRRRLRVLTEAWLFATVANAFVAIADRFAHTGISLHLLGPLGVSAGRQAGLTQQPNHLALAIAMVIPVAIAWQIRTGRRRAGLSMIAVLFVGLYLTGSRGGLAAGAVAVPLTLYLYRPARRQVWWIGWAALLITAFYGQRLVDLALRRNRLGGTAGSDVARSLVRHQGWADFWHSPLHGIGYSVINDAHEVHLQLLAAGGVLALIGFAVYMTSAARMAWRAGRIDQLYSRALLVSIGAWLMMMFVENQVSDRYMFVPVAIALTLGRLRPAPIAEAPLLEFAARQGST